MRILQSFAFPPGNLGCTVQDEEDVAMDSSTNHGPPFSEAEDAPIFSLSPGFGAESSYRKQADCYSSSVRMQCPFQIDTALPVDLYED